MLIAESLSLAEANAVDDRGVIEGVGDDGILLGKQRLEKAAVGVEAGGVEDGFLHSDKIAEPLFQFFMLILRATDEADAGHAIAALIQRRPRRGDDGGLIRQAQIIIRTEIKHLAAVDFDLDALG